MVNEDQVQGLQGACKLKVQLEKEYEDKGEDSFYDDLIAGHSGSTPSINGSHTVTVVDPTNFTIPVNVSSGGTGGTMTVTSTRNGVSAYLLVNDIGSLTATVSIEDSQDDSTFANLISFTAVVNNTEPTAERKTVTGIVDRYLRIVTTGTFSNLDFAVFVRRGTANDTPGIIT